MEGDSVVEADNKPATSATSTTVAVVDGRIVASAPLKSTSEHGEISRDQPLESNLDEQVVVADQAHVASRHSSTAPAAADQHPKETHVQASAQDEASSAAQGLSAASTDDCKKSASSAIDIPAVGWTWDGDPISTPRTAPITPQEVKGLSGDTPTVTFYASATCSQLTLKPSMFVLLQGPSFERLIVGRVLHLFHEKQLESMMVTVRILPYPEDTKIGRLPQHGQDEIVRSNGTTSHASFSINAVHSTCKVVNFSEYCRIKAQQKKNRLLEQPIDDEPVFFFRLSRKRNDPRRKRDVPYKRVKSVEYAAALGESFNIGGDLADTHVLSALIRRGAFDDQINVRNEEGKTRLHVGAAKGNDALVQALVDNGAGVDIPDFKGNTALIYAARANHTNIIKLLLAKNADPNATNEQGETALHVAAERGNVNMVTALMRRSANPNLPNSAGQTAVDLAADAETKHALLMTRGARRAAVHASKALSHLGMYSSLP